MNLRQPSNVVKREPPFGARSFAPDDPSPSSRRATRDVQPSLREASPNRLRFRARLVWSDPEVRGGSREEIVEFGDARKLLDLLRRVTESPERPLQSARFEALVKPHWCDVDLDYVRWRAAQRDRRDEIRRAMDRRAAERAGRPDRTLRGPGR